jgi:hypothetical protein
VLYAWFFWPFMLLGWPAIAAVAAFGTHVAIRGEARWERIPKAREFRNRMFGLGGRAAVIVGYCVALTLTLSTCVAVLG